MAAKLSVPENMSLLLPVLTKAGRKRGETLSVEHLNSIYLSLQSGAQSQNPVNA